MLLAIDAGTTSVRALIFDKHARCISLAQQEFAQYFPQEAWVEHNPEDIWQCTLAVCKGALTQAKLTAQDIAAIGITNQRETTVLWDKESGEAIYNAIVWQDRRTQNYCQQLQTQGAAADIQQRTGLIIDPYFSASKIQWILDHIPQARQKATNAQLAFGTIDSFLLWRLSDGQLHATDATNAARTQLFNIHDNQWDPNLLELFNIPADILPIVKNSSDDFAMCSKQHFGHAIPICSLIGDQQAAALGQHCFHPGMVKSTYGTGCFLLQNTGQHANVSQHQLLTTIAYRIDNQTHYALEGSIFNAGTSLEWLKKNLGIIEHVDDIESMLQTLDGNGGVRFIPAFTGLGAPHWDPDARAAILGMTRDTSREHIVRAAIEACAYQTRDLIEAMQADGAPKPQLLRIDGGMANNNWLCAFLADLLQTNVQRPADTETTALGAAYLAGLQCGLFKSFTQIDELATARTSFEPSIDSVHSKRLYDGWLQDVRRIRN